MGGRATAGSSEDRAAARGQRGFQMTPPRRP